MNHDRPSALDGDLKMTEWKPIQTAPQDGSWFLSLGVIHIIGPHRPNSISPEIRIIRRVRSSDTSSGYWQDTWGHSVADSQAGQMWAPLSALPLKLLAEQVEAKRRDQGGDPMGLPVPLGEGKVLTEPETA